MDILLTGFRSNEYFTTLPRGYKTIFLHNSTEHEISSAYSTKLLRMIYIFLTLKHSDDAFILLINIEMPMILGILISMSRRSFILSCIEHE